VASIPYLLMTEFYDMSRAALKDENYDANQAFSSAESLTNNYLHGRTPAVCLGLTKNAILSIIESDDHTPEEVEAYKEAIIVIDIFAEQYGLELPPTDYDESMPRI